MTLNVEPARPYLFPRRRSVVLFPNELRRERVVRGGHSPFAIRSTGVLLEKTADIQEHYSYKVKRV
jgi:hypothetical protein